MLNFTIAMLAPGSFIMSVDRWFSFSSRKVEVTGYYLTHDYVNYDYHILVMPLHMSMAWFVSLIFVFCQTIKMFPSLSLGSFAEYDALFY